MLHIVIGPMYAGKTSRLIHHARNISEPKVLLDFETNDVEKCYKGTLKNHDDVELQCIKCKHLFDTLSIYNVRDNLQLLHDEQSVFDLNLDPIKHSAFYEIPNLILYSKYIFINEAQFFPDLKAFVLEQLTKNKHIYIYGLDGDFQQNKMGQIMDLIPYCDDICKLKSKCSKCSNDAIFSHRITKDKQQYLVDENAYIPLCRKCIG